MPFYKKTLDLIQKNNKIGDENMTNIGDRVLCLKLNRLWQAVGTQTVAKAMGDLVTGVIDALDIVYPMNEDNTPDFSQHDARPVSWDEWITLPVYPWQPSVKTLRGLIRVPTVVVSKNYQKMPKKQFSGKPSKEGLFFRDKGRCAYTGKLLDWDNASIDHVIPLGRGGTDTYENTVLTSKELNNWKGHRLNNECGLKLLIVPTKPKKVDKMFTIRKAHHIDWKKFLRTTEVAA